VQEIKRKFGITCEPYSILDYTLRYRLIFARALTQKSQIENFLCLVLQSYS
jgi:hypothetical protein